MAMTSIAILSLDRRNDIKNCINSIYWNTDPDKTPFEVIILDQNSNKITKSYLKSLSFPSLKVLFLRENIGCARGRKKALGLCSSRSDLIFQSDNDMTFDRGWLEKLTCDMRRNNKLGALQARCISPAGKTLLNGGFIERFTIDGKMSRKGYIAFFMDSGTSRHRKPGKNGLLFCDYVSGGATLFRRKLLENVSYDERFLNGYEDYDLSIRARKKGWLLACDHNVIAVHHNRRLKDADFFKDEARYIKIRENNKTLYKSLIAFIRKHGINPVRSDKFDFVIKDRRGRPFCEYSDKELEYYFDKETSKGPEAIL
jgi:GT2 family glycosyltransferase